ncbi:V1/V3 family capsid protein [Sulfolobus sp. E11-6]|uniref:V1/V3 family capsid protein n=2 Tax=Sulfolobus sp. E11-6 TaxID=2663020 RepID=UPI001296DBBF|nr:V1/V3 family capsid protein [Sulfolobus sp. E11-6]QGA67430.1 DUF1035 domain-containing protein [Sulfolobus sp. E11-6]QGA87231.1 VP3 [Sulfolobus spindle-shaped virus SSV19]
MEVNVKTIIFLFLFIVIGVILLGPIMSYIQNVTTPYYTTVITSGTLTQTSTISNTNYAGSTGSILVSVVPIFYILILIIVPAVIAYKYWREE